MLLAGKSHVASPLAAATNGLVLTISSWLACDICTVYTCVCVCVDAQKYQGTKSDGSTSAALSPNWAKTLVL